MVRKGNAISSNTSQEDLDIKCLQLLRAVVHNEERKLPEDWDTKTAESKIKGYICTYLSYEKDLVQTIQL
jgi:hypothetical protein